SVIENPHNGRGKQYAEWQAEQSGKPTYRSGIKKDVDTAIKQSMTERQFFDNLRKMGYTIKVGKDITITAQGKERGIKLCRNFGDEYSVEGIRKRILVQTRPQLPPPSPKLIVRKYKLKGDFKTAKKVTGLRALYFHYLYKMGILPKKNQQSRKQVQFIFREDLRNLDKITKEVTLLCKERIDTVEQLYIYKEGLTVEIAALTEERKNLRNLCRRKNISGSTAQSEIKNKITNLSARLGELRKEVGLCNDITARSVDMKAKMKQSGGIGKTTLFSKSKATVAAVKAIIAVVKGLVALIAAGGWVAVLIILIICMIAMLVGSIFGIFFSGEGSETGGRTMPDVVTELTTEFYGKTDGIIAENEHDVLDMDFMYINWAEVLAVYAVKVNTDPNNPTEVITLDDNKIDILREILNDMVTLSHSTETTEQERTVIDEDGKETVETVTVTVLTIGFNHKSAEEMAIEYGFNQTQKELMRELLSPDYADLWAALLGGYIRGNGEIGTPDSSYIPNDIFSFPVGEGFNISSHFGYREDPFSDNEEIDYHRGTDIAAPEGTPILAMAGGIVTVANSTDSWGGGWGFYVKIAHNQTYSTLYAHCSRIAVVDGQEVKQGEVIGYVGSTGRSTGAHLHFEMWKNGIRVDPIGYFE
ncbi:MAG: M23 family metallopeptidase, partial [Oscillospiraceae bacterium]|nr:M23 family metallopeptidase [Oscillospiraceae bacterium]